MAGIHDRICPAINPSTMPYSQLRPILTRMSSFFRMNEAKDETPTDPITQGITIELLGSPGVGKSSLIKLFMAASPNTWTANTHRDIPLPYDDYSITDMDADAILHLLVSMKLKALAAKRRPFLHCATIAYRHSIELIKDIEYHRTRSAQDSGLIIDDGILHRFPQELLNAIEARAISPEQLKNIVRNRAVILLNAPEKAIKDRLVKRHGEKRSWIADKYGFYGEERIEQAIATYTQERIQLVDILARHGYYTATIDAGAPINNMLDQLMKIVQTITTGKARQDTAASERSS